MIRNLLQGKPLKHPLHPMLVHLPIALFVVSFLLDIASFVWGGNDLVQPAGCAMLIGILTALLAAVPGFADFSTIRADHPTRKIAIAHMILNLAAVIVYAIDLSFRLRLRDVSKTPFTPFAFSIVGVALLSISGYLGGVMVYDDGIAVGRHRRWSKTPKTTLRPSIADAVDGWVVAARSEQLAKDQTLRIEIAATVMVLARVDGQVYAVQEFCTHRCGPLSDGALHDCQIECPWHRSCFDLKTGKPTHGPAKVDLRTFEVRESDDNIWVRVPIAVQLLDATSD
jgi:nitrite reductase/ring-hydroxylating ferredoxin subunit/uncharacterized membrane protein